MELRQRKLGIFSAGVEHQPLSRRRAGLVELRKSELGRFSAGENLAGLPDNRSGLDGGKKQPGGGFFPLFGLYANGTRQAGPVWWGSGEKSRKHGFFPLYRYESDADRSLNSISGLVLFMLNRSGQENMNWWAAGGLAAPKIRRPPELADLAAGELRQRRCSPLAGSSDHGGRTQEQAAGLCRMSATRRSAKASETAGSGGM